MKSLLPSIITLVALAGVVTCGPIAISDNNIGDIITVGMNIDANIESEVNTNIANIIAAILIKMGDQQQRPPMPPRPPGPQPTTPAPPIMPTLPPLVPTITPPQPAMGVDDLVSAIQEIRQKSANLSKDQKEQLWRDHSEEFVKRLMANRY